MPPTNSTADPAGLAITSSLARVPVARLLLSRSTPCEATKLCVPESMGLFHTSMPVPDFMKVELGATTVATFIVSVPVLMIQ